MIRLQNDHIALTLRPDFGARVTSLTDLASGRQWLVAGDCTGGVGYLGDQARGWDECFPTVGPCDHPAWGAAMRYHGELWGRPWQVEADGTACTATCTTPGYTFGRSLALQDETLTASYTVQNPGPAPLPYLWSQHALLATTPADRIVLRGITALQAQGQPFDWPDHPSRDLTRPGTQAEGFELKAYGEVQAEASAEVIGPDAGLRFQWSGLDIPGFGLWLDYGGWPPGAPVHQIALEPTSAPSDDLAQAARMGRARILAPGASHRWSVCITMTQGAGRTPPSQTRPH